MSLSASWNTSLWSKLLGLFRAPKDPVLKNLRESIYMLDKMASFIDSTRRVLEEKYEEHQRRAKLYASEGKREYQAIFEEESKHISTLLTLFSKVYYDLIRVRYRLETISMVEEPMKLLPEIAQELDMIKPEIERIAPELTVMLHEVRRRIASIMATTSTSLEAFAALYSDGKASSSSGEVKENKQAPESRPLPLPPRDTPVNTANTVKLTSAIENRPLNINTVKKLIIEEIKKTGGVFVVNDFARKYGIPVYVVREALKKLEEEGLIKTR